MTGRVIVIGAINVDFVITAPHLPAPGETVVGNGLSNYGGGKGANAAVAASRAGANVTLVGAVGDDDSGKYALDLLKKDGVDISGVDVINDEPTGAALIVVDTKGENQIVLGPGANGAVSSTHVRDALADLLPTADVVLVSAEIPFGAISAAVESTLQAGVLCILNPAPVLPELTSLLSKHVILTPNEIELSELTRNLVEDSTEEIESDSITGSLRILAENTLAPVIATLGGDGCAIMLPGGEVEKLPNRIITEVVDTTGAGDTFNGVFASCLAKGDELQTAISTAMVAASLSVGAVGAREGMPSAKMISIAANKISV